MKNLNLNVIYTTKLLYLILQGRAVHGLSHTDMELFLSFYFFITEDGIISSA